MTKITVKYDADEIDQCLAMASGCPATHVRTMARLSDGAVEQIVEMVRAYATREDDPRGEAIAKIATAIRSADVAVTAEADTDLESLTKAKRKWAPKEAK